MRVIYAPQSIPKEGHTVFLAGSIEMGIAENWQERFIKSHEKEDIIILNPRRTDWDNTWVQDISNPKFREQVEWELNAMERADEIFMYFDPTTKSPISLLELGLFTRTGKMIVCCPKGFWRKGNVDVVCEKYGVIMVNDF